MRSSKNRSRSKSNRQRSLGNIVNRVFDSSGPEGKVRGTPQQIIDKYLALARDAQLGSDRVAEQNFLQHAEHYTRMLGEALREQESRQQQQQQNGDHNGGGHQGGNGQNGQASGHGGDDRGERQGGERQGGERNQQNRRRGDDPRGPRAEDQRRTETPADTPDESRAEDDGPGLVDTPEARMDAAPRASMMPDLSQAEGAAPAAEAEEKPARKPAQRRPRKPKAQAEGEAAPAPVASED